MTLRFTLAAKTIIEHVMQGPYLFQINTLRARASAHARTHKHTETIENGPQCMSANLFTIHTAVFLHIIRIGV